jgi:glycerol uptake facilitator-like aquaporin
VSALEIAVNPYQALFVAFNRQIDNVYVVIGIFALILSILLTITLLFWYYRPIKNIHSFGAKEVSSPEWRSSGGSFQ